MSYSMLLRQNLHDDLEAKLKILNSLRPISGGAVQKLKEKFEIEMTYNSNAIEGNTLSLQETFWVVQQGITVKGKSLKEHLEAKNHQEALEFLYDMIEHEKRHTFSERLVKDIHSLIIQDINREISGKYREIDVFISGSDHTPPSALKLQDEMRGLLSWAAKEQKNMYIVDFAAIFHHKFVHIHPFEDGNGRTGRLLMNIFLMQYGFPLSIILKNDRQKYYRVLGQADNGNYKPLINFIGQAVLRSLNIYLDTLTPAKEKSPFISLAQATKYCDYSQEYLSKLAKEGRLDAHKAGRNWVTTKEAIEKYVQRVS